MNEAFKDSDNKDELERLKPPTPRAKKNVNNFASAAEMSS